MAVWLHPFNGHFLQHKLQHPQECSQASVTRPLKMHLLHCCTLEAATSRELKRIRSYDFV
jgi:hypothetical protein